MKSRRFVALQGGVLVAVVFAWTEPAAAVEVLAADFSVQVNKVLNAVQQDRACQPLHSFTEATIGADTVRLFATGAPTAAVVLRRTSIAPFVVADFSLAPALAAVPLAEQCLRRHLAAAIQTCPWQQAAVQVQPAEQRMRPSRSPVVALGHAVAAWLAAAAAVAVAWRWRRRRAVVALRAGLAAG